MDAGRRWRWRGIGGAVFVGALTGIVFAQLHVLAWPMRLLLAVLLVPLPALVVGQAKRGEIEELPRPRIYADSILSLWVLALLSALAVWASGVDFEEIGVRPLASAPLAAWSIGLTAAGLAVIAAARMAGVREAALLSHLLPRDRRERRLFAALSVTAGICEELVFRGFMLHALLLATGSTPIAVAIAAGAFGVVHAYQGPAGAARAAVLGLLLTVPVLVTGSILAPIIAHVALDLLAGLVLRDRLLR
jgi:uncharacterized protein